MDDEPQLSVRMQAIDCDVHTQSRIVIASAMSTALLLAVLSLPTAPLHEDHVVAFVKAFAQRAGIRFRTDRFGNVILQNYVRGRPALVVMAHMDHPAVEVVRVRGRDAVVAIRGGLAAQQVARARFVFYPADRQAGPERGEPIRGVGQGLDARGRIRIRTVQPLPMRAFGTLDLSTPRIVNGRVKAPAIDNLAGCAQVLTLLQSVRRSTHRVMGVLTRGEEIGFHGAAALVRQRTLPRNTPIVVLEASSAKAARVAISGGPVIRVGDRLIGFDPRMDCWLQHSAARLAKRDRQFHYQRALMSGGAMEASLYVLDGLMVGALALPLGNYHNRGPRGPAPEVIAWTDWLNLHKLLRVLVTAPSVEKIVLSVKQRLMKGSRP